MKKLEQYWQRGHEALHKLSSRERYMVIFATALVFMAGIGSTLWYTHKMALEQQQRATELKDLVVWMQTEAASMQPAMDSQLSAVDKVQRVAQQQGLAVSLQQNGEAIELNTTHAQYTVLAMFLTQLAQNGLSVEKMQMSSDGTNTRLVATVL